MSDVTPAHRTSSAESATRLNSRYSTRFSSCSSPTGPITVSPQDTQIVQSWLDLDDFLPGFTPSGRQL